MLRLSSRWEWRVMTMSEGDTKSKFTATTSRLLHLDFLHRRASRRSISVHLHTDAGEETFLQCLENVGCYLSDATARTESLKQETINPDLTPGFTHPFFDGVSPLYIYCRTTQIHHFWGHTTLEILMKEYF